MRPRWNGKLSALGLTMLVGCAGEGGSRLQTWMATVDTLGDTIVVRTTAGSVWTDTVTLTEEVRIGVLEGADEYMFGEVPSLAVSAAGDIYVMDSHVPALRKYDSAGTYVATFGRKGGGPGEYNRPDGGLGVLPDGRVILRDPGNARFNLYSPEGEYLDAWRLPAGGGFNTDDPLYVDTQGNTYTTVLLEVGAAPWDWTYGLARFTPEGEHTDTLPVPTWDFERAVVTGERKGSRSSSSVPFTPNTSWTFSPLGHFVGGVSTDYRFDLYQGRNASSDRAGLVSRRGATRGSRGAGAEDSRQFQPTIPGMEMERTEHPFHEARIPGAVCREGRHDMGSRRATRPRSDDRGSCA